MTTIEFLLCAALAMFWLWVLRVIGVGVRQCWPSRDPLDPPALGKIRVLLIGFHPVCFHIGTGGELWSCIRPKERGSVFDEFDPKQRATYLNLKLAFAWWTLSINIRITKWRSA